MNKAITEGLALMPPAFAEGLENWSSGDGTPGAPSYAGAANAAFVPADQDFGGCLELLKTESVQRLRAFMQTPIVPGLYLRVRARVKALSGTMPAVRIAAWAGDAAGAPVGGLVLTGPSVQLESYGEVVTVSAIIGTGARGGVDMPWGLGVSRAHVGLDLTGFNGGTVRIDDIEVEDVTAAFLRDMIDRVDVRDFGAIGDNAADCTAAFIAADAAAGGRTVLVPEGTYFLADHVTFENPVRFQGQVRMPAAKRLTLIRNYSLDSYIDAFGSEREALERALAVLFNFSDHESLDLCGRRVAIDRPIDVQAVVATRDTFSMRRVIRHGQIEAVESEAWTPQVVRAQARYAPSDPLRLTGVANIGAVPVGALVSGAGVGREVYVRERNIGAGTLTLSAPLYGAEGVQTFTFTRFRYLLDFSGFAALDKLVLDDIELQCAGRASALMLPPAGLIFHVRDCFINRPRDRGITSIGRGCQGMLIDRCQFLSNEQAARVQDRTTIALNANANDLKLRDNRVVRFAHFGVIGGTGHLIAGNHVFQGDEAAQGLRSAGIVLTTPNARSTVQGNYIDNCALEWTNEHDERPDFTTGFSFGGLSVTGNIFTVSDMARWFRFVIIKPYGAGQFLHGFSLSHNVFRTFNGAIDRVDHVDTTHADLDMGRARNITVEGNSFNGVTQITLNPAPLVASSGSLDASWSLEAGPWLPFGGRARVVTGLAFEGEVTDGGGGRVAAMPTIEPEKGAARNEVALLWPAPCRGAVRVSVRMDNPL